MPGKVSITFDDGLSSVYWLALPEMEKYRMGGTAFVISDLIGKKYFGHPVMDEKMLIELSSAGWEIGSHTKTHPDLLNLSGKQLDEELRLSRQRLESLVKKPVTSLAYPYGRFDRKTVVYAKRHYARARTLSRYPPLRLNKPTHNDLMRLKSMSNAIQPASSLPGHLRDIYVPHPIRGRVYRILRNKYQSSPLVHANERKLDGRIIAKWIQKSRNAWLIICFHNVTLERTGSAYDVALDDFRQILKAIETKSELVIPVASGCMDDT